MKMTFYTSLFIMLPWLSFQSNTYSMPQSLANPPAPYYKHKGDTRQKLVAYIQNLSLRNSVTINVFGDLACVFSTHPPAKTCTPQGSEQWKIYNTSYNTPVEFSLQTDLPPCRFLINISNGKLGVTSQCTSFFLCVAIAGTDAPIIYSCNAKYHSTYCTKNGMPSCPRGTVKLQPTSIV